MRRIYVLFSFGCFGLAVAIFGTALSLDDPLPAEPSPVVIERTVLAERIVVWTPTVERKQFIPTPTPLPIVTDVPPTPTPIFGDRQTSGRSQLQ